MSTILRSLAYFLLQVMLLLSVLFLFRGHNHPGGGFIGALIAGASVGLVLLAYGKMPRIIEQHFFSLLAAGVACLVFPFLIAWMKGLPILSAVWWQYSFFGYPFKIGTPIIFDAGIYIAVFSTISMILAKLEQK